MKIDAAEISLSANHSYVQQHARRETLVEGVARNGVWNPDELAEGVAITREGTSADTFEEGRSLLERHLAGRRQARAASQRLQEGLSERVLDDLSLLVQQATQPLSALAAVEETVPLDAEPTSQDRAKIDLLVATIEQLSGKKLRLLEPRDLELGREEAVEPEALPAPTEGEAETAPPAWGLHYTYHERYYEAETSSFHADGVIRTRDGREIAVEVDLTMSRQFAREQHLEVQMGAALQDPLVVNFEGTAAELSQTRFQFDLDSDGAEEQINFVGPGSGFLAVDANGNGQVDDGSELFGPATGNGFGELAAHDEDGNEWIDEQDSIYSQLRVWTRDQMGNDQLMGLGQRGIGAIYLGHVTTPFEVKDEENQLQAAVRSSGIYLNEDGSAGTVQQVDLVV